MRSRPDRSAPPTSRQGRPRRAAAAAALVGVAVLGTAACDDTTSSPSSTTSASTPTPVPTTSTPLDSPSATPVGPVSLPPSPVPTNGPLTAPFGPACDQLPDTGAGSRTAVSRQRVAAAIADVPQLSRAAAVLRTAGLADTLNSQNDATVFVPDNTAFDQVGSADLRRALADPRRASDVLRYHVVPGRLTPDQLPGAHRTLEGQSLTVTGSGQDLTVDGRAHVVCGNLQTANATVYVIDAVLQP